MMKTNFGYLRNVIPKQMIYNNCLYFLIFQSEISLLICLNRSIELWYRWPCTNSFCFISFHCYDPDVLMDNLCNFYEHQKSNIICLRPFLGSNVTFVFFDFRLCSFHSPLICLCFIYFFLFTWLLGTRCIVHNIFPQVPQIYFFLFLLKSYHLFFYFKCYSIHN